MKWWWVVVGLAVAMLIGGSLYWMFSSQGEDIVLPVVKKILEKPLDKYTIEKLGEREYKSEIVLDEAIATASAYTVYKFRFDSDGKKVTGLAHIPQDCPCPVIVQFRGYVDAEKYTPGMGTKKTAEVFARNGFISLAPDFLGYGGSDNPSADIFEARFETWTTALNLIAATEKLVNWSTGQLGLWGHSNGGQIALTVLEITGKAYPTVLWAPVSNPFPYSILYYTDEAEDRGKLLRRRLAEFEKDYDVDLYDLTRHLDRIDAPLQVHQGTADESVPQKWSDELVQKLEANYYVYPGADHNLLPGWNLAINRDVEFFSTLWK